MSAAAKSRSALVRLADLPREDRVAECRRRKWKRRKLADGRRVWADPEDGRLYGELRMFELEAKRDKLEDTAHLRSREELEAQAEIPELPGEPVEGLVDPDPVSPTATAAAAVATATEASRDGPTAALAAAPEGTGEEEGEEPPAAELDELARLRAEAHDRSGAEADDVVGLGPAVSRVAFRAVTLDDFAAVEEAGAGALLGEDREALIPENADVMLYGDGGVGKTTLVVDMACHLTAGDRWLGIAVARPLRVLVIENEGPRALFRAKIRAKRGAWQGSPIGDRLLLLEEPWAQFTFADSGQRETLARLIRELELDVVIVGPVAASGMEDAGTLQEVRAFSRLLAQVRMLSGRRVTFVLVHHEAKGGKVSGAWEGCGDTLLHVQGEGRGRTRVHVQKARWASSLHKRTLHLAWTEEGEGFAVVDADAREARREAKVAEALEWIVAYVSEHPGSPRSRVEDAFHEAHAGGRNTARTAVDRELERLARWREGGETKPLLATTTGETRHGIYLIPFGDAVSPLAACLFGETGEEGLDPEPGRPTRHLAARPTGGERSGERDDGVAR